DKSASVIVASSTLTVTEAEHGDRYIALGNAAGFTTTLPEATGTGNKYTFIVTITITSGDYIIHVKDSDEKMVGAAVFVDDDATPGLGKGWATGVADDTITMDETKGGTLGGKVVLIDIADTMWFVEITGP
ncbi:unnamed protein product, partial [marine sediment metagenome]